MNKIICSINSFIDPHFLLLDLLHKTAQQYAVMTSTKQENIQKELKTQHKEDPEIKAKDESLVKKWL